jgi:hypothetical protein
MPRGKDLFDDDFDARFDKMWERHDKMLDHPVRTFLGVGLVALVLNLIFWGAIIALIIWGLTVIL